MSLFYYSTEVVGCDLASMGMLMIILMEERGNADVEMSQKRCGTSKIEGGFTEPGAKLGVELFLACRAS